MMRLIAQMSIVSLLLSVASATAAEVSMKNIPQEAVDEMAFRVGEWEFRPFIDGVELPDSGHEVTTWSPTGKYCIIMTQTAVESGAPRAGTGIAGWDPAKKQLVERWQSSDGMYLSFHYTIDRRRNVSTGNFTCTYSDGKQVGGKCSIQKSGNDQWRWDASWVEDGKERTRSGISRRVN